MTTMKNFEILDIADAGSIPAKESLWSRMVRQMASMFHRIWDHMNEGMGRAEGSDNYSPTDACCS